MTLGRGLRFIPTKLLKTWSLVGFIYHFYQQSRIKKIALKNSNFFLSIYKIFSFFILVYFLLIFPFEIQYIVVMYTEIKFLKFFRFRSSALLKDVLQFLS